MVNPIKTTNISAGQIQVKQVNLFYGDFQALYDVSIKIFSRQVTALIGPSGCGKSSLLRLINRMNELIDNMRLEGHIFIDGKDIYSSEINVVALRKFVGMVFQKSNPFPKSIYDNIAYGPRIHGITHKSELTLIVETSLQQAGLWEEVKDRLSKNAMELSGGQQQRLCIARALAVNPEIILMDEPTSALDPVATEKIEELIRQLRQRYTIVIVTHNMQQARRLADQTAFLYKGHLVEVGMTEQIFTAPTQAKTAEYVSGRFG